MLKTNQGKGYFPKCILVLSVFLASYQSFAVKKEKKEKEQQGKAESNELTQAEKDKKVAFKNKPVKKLTFSERQEICKQYKEKYISYTGKDIFYVSTKCKRKLMELKEAQELTKNGVKIYQVDSDTIKALKKEKSKKKYSFGDVYQKYSEKCVMATRVVYKVIENGKKPYPDLATARQSCPDIIPVAVEELRMLPDKEEFPSIFDILYSKKKEQKELELIEEKVVCGNLKIGKIYSFHSKVYKLKKNTERPCYLAELDTHVMSVRLQLETAEPKELTGSEYLSLYKEKSAKPKKQKKEK